MQNSSAQPQVLISGGGGDLARAMAREFVQTGAVVNAPSRAEMDVSDEASVQAYFSRFGRLDVLVASAGLTHDGALTGLESADFDEVVNANLRGAFLCARAALKPMLAQRAGHILFVGSRAARVGTRGQSLYAAAKAGLIALAQSIAREYGARNIRCNVVLPGFLETRMTAQLPDHVREKSRQEHALGRFNTAANAARFITFVAGLDHVSGQVFTLDSRIDKWT